MGDDIDITPTDVGDKKETGVQNSGGQGVLGGGEKEKVAGEVMAGLENPTKLPKNEKGVDYHIYSETERKEVIEKTLGGDPNRHGVHDRVNLADDSVLSTYSSDYAKQAVRRRPPLVELASLLEKHSHDDEIVQNIISRCKGVIEVLGDDSSEEAKQALDLAVNLLDKIIEKTNTYDRQHYANLVKALGQNDSEMAWRIRNLIIKRTENCRDNDKVHGEMAELTLLKEALRMDSEEASKIIKQLVTRKTKLSGFFDTKQQWESFKTRLDEWLSKHTS